MKSQSFNFPENAHLGRTAFEVELPTGVLLVCRRQGQEDLFFGFRCGSAGAR